MRKAREDFRVDKHVDNSAVFFLGIAILQNDDKDSLLMFGSNLE